MTMHVDIHAITTLDSHHYFEPVVLCCWMIIIYEVRLQAALKVVQKINVSFIHFELLSFYLVSLGGRTFIGNE